jgi:hypothetical protein
MDWQTLTALACVLITLLIFIFKLTRPKKNSGCDHGCDCRKK